MNQKILGCLLGAAVGDAMGAAAQRQNLPDRLKRTFGGRVKEFREPPMDTMARGETSRTGDGCVQYSLYPY